MHVSLCGCTHACIHVCECFVSVMCITHVKLKLPGLGTKPYTLYQVFTVMVYMFRMVTVNTFGLWNRPIIHR